MAEILYDNLDEILRIEDRCNENCLYCNVSYQGLDEIVRDFSACQKKIDQFIKNGVKMISITGGEPALNHNLLEIIKYIKGKGLKANLQTNAGLIDDFFAKKLKETGLDFCLVTLLTTNKNLHNDLKISIDSFEKTVKGINNLLKNHIKVIINVLVTAQNYKDIVKLISFIKKEFPEIKEVSLSFIQPHGKALINKELLPNYLEIKDEIRRILKEFKKFNFDVGNPYCGIPLCIWQNPYFGLDSCLDYQQNEYLRKNKSVSQKNQGKIIIKEKKQGQECFNCYLKNLCNGYWHEYDDIFKQDFIAPQFLSLKYFD